MEVILIVSVIVASILAALIGAICVRYIKIYFAMLTLAFGMLFYTFLLKFYYLTGGDEGMRVLSPIFLGLIFLRFRNAISYGKLLSLYVCDLSDPYLHHVEDHLVAVRALSEAIRDNPEKLNIWG